MDESISKSFIANSDISGLKTFLCWILGMREERMPEEGLGQPMSQLGPQHLPGRQLHHALRHPDLSPVQLQQPDLLTVLLAA